MILVARCSLLHESKPSHNGRYRCLQSIHNHHSSHRLARYDRIHRAAGDIKLFDVMVEQGLAGAEAALRLQLQKMDAEEEKMRRVHPASSMARSSARVPPTLLS